MSYILQIYGPVGVVAGAALIMVAHRRLQAAAQPVRYQLLEVADKLADRSLTDEQRNHVEMVVRRAFGMTLTLAMGTVVVPCIAVMIIFSRRVFDDFNEEMDSEPETASLFYKLSEIHMRLSFLNNPILTLLLNAEILLLIPAATLLAAILQGRAKAVSHRAILSQVENYSWNGPHDGGVMNPAC